MDGGPRPEWCNTTCGVCPGQELGPGQFDVIDRPGREYAYNPEIGWRVGPDGVAVCVHPYRVGLPVGAYASAGVPVPAAETVSRPKPSPAALELPEDETDLEGWLVAVVRDAGPDYMAWALGRAERVAATRYTPGAIVTAMRRVLSVELVDRG